MPTSITRLEQVSLWQLAWRELRENRKAMAGLLYLLALVLLALLTPWIAPYSYETQNLATGATPPSAAHWLGTDVHGRDLLTRMLYGSRISLAVALAATAVSLTVGICWGLVAGYVGGRLDAIMMRIVDVLYALPFMIFIILLTVVLGRSLLLLFLAIGLLEWLTLSRIVRAEVRKLRQREYVQAAITLGLDRRRILLRHILPNVLGPVIVYTSLTIPGVMLLEAFLSFLGLGIQPPHSSWGVLISRGVESMEAYPWLLLFPSLALTTTLLALNVLGDGLRDALDPKAERGETNPSAPVA